jgi:hypothetical protein
VALEALPLAADEVWEGGSGTLAARLPTGSEGEAIHPELAMWVVSRSGEILASQVTPPGGGAEALIDLLPQAMRDPEVGRPRRPGTLRVGHPEAFQQLRQRFAPLGIAVEEARALEEWQHVFDTTNRAVSPVIGGYHPTTPEHGEALAGLFRAAAAFYRAAPWRVVDENRPLGLNVPAAPGHTLGLMVMGAGGENRGLVLFATLDIMAEFIEAVAEGPPEALDLTDLPPALSLNFTHAEDMPPESVQEAREHGWEVADTDAYPLLLASEPGTGIVLDLSPEPLTLMTTALQAVTQFCQAAEAELRAGRPSVVRDVEVELEGETVSLRLSSPPVEQGPRRRARKPAPGPRGR